MFWGQNIFGQFGGRSGRPGIVVGSVALGDMIGSTCGDGPGQASGPVRAAAEVKTSSGEAEPPGTVGIKEMAECSGIAPAWEEALASALPQWRRGPWAPRYAVSVVGSLSYPCGASITWRVQAPAPGMARHSHASASLDLVPVYVYPLEHARLPEVEATVVRVAPADVDVPGPVMSPSAISAWSQWPTIRRSIHANCSGVKGGASSPWLNNLPLESNQIGSPGQYLLIFNTGLPKN